MTDILFMLDMIVSAVTKKKSPVAPERVNWERIFKISSKHNISNIIAYSILNGEYNIPEDIKQMFVKNMYLRVAASENQKSEIMKIMQIFSEEGIDFMPFKGLFLSNLYPSIDMRYMSDADILIRKEQAEKADLAMKKLGYEFEIEGPIEYNYIKRPYMHIELHHCIMSPSSEDLYDYYKDSWKFAKPSSEPHHYELNTEDQYVFTFTHFARHYRDAGAGIKSIIDLWLFEKKYPEMDWDYITKQMEIVGMSQFYQSISRLIKVWFEKEKMDGVSLEMTEFIISSGTFGTLKNSISAREIRKHKGKDLSKVGENKYLKLLFPEMEYMKIIFPVLEKCPVFLPILWVWRLIRGAIFKKKNISVHLNNTKYIDSDNAKEYLKHMKTVGLDIYNGRGNK